MAENVLNHILSTETGDDFRSWFFSLFEVSGIFLYIFSAIARAPSQIYGALLLHSNNNYFAHIVCTEIHLLLNLFGAFIFMGAANNPLEPKAVLYNLQL